MNTLAILSLLLLVLYVLKILFYKYKWSHYPKFEISGAATEKISIVIAFRNEISNLDNLLFSLSSQNYPKENFEVILVDDHSEDGSEGLAREFCNEHLNIRLLHNDAAENGKKSAVMKGVRNATYDLIVTTDADCTLHENWLKAMAQAFRETNADLIVGLVDMISSGSFFGRFQEIEFLSLVASGAAATAAKHPIYCNGACLAYRKSVFLAFSDPMKLKIPSGDDTLFMHEIKRKSGNRIALVKAVHAIVTTRGTATLHDFFQQRKRWVSKAPYYRDFDILYTAVLVFLVNLSVLYALILLVTGLNVWLFPVMYTIKLLTDRGFLKSYLRFYSKDLPEGWFMLYEMVYPFYAVLIAVAGIFSGFSWKGRRTGPNFPTPT
jgi:cellulose synthase/poly-beta-1,6-N-acetylglucosamine synthase-like glycosyltransferase